MIIAEIGNNHLGNFNKAKELIRSAKNSGASLAKLQAIDPVKIESGSMTGEFYQKVALTLDEYIELIEYGDLIGIPVFYSIFFKDKTKKIILESKQNYHKISSSQYNHVNGYNLPLIDHNNYFISVLLSSSMLPFRNANVLYVTQYLTSNPKTKTIRTMTNKLGRQVGLSDHTVGISNCKLAIEKYRANVIEKHFILERDKDNIFFKGVKFRDCVHSCTPREFEELVIFKERHENE